MSSILLFIGFQQHNKLEIAASLGGLFLSRLPYFLSIVDDLVNVSCFATHHCLCFSFAIYNEVAGLYNWGHVTFVLVGDFCV